MLLDDIEWCKQYNARVSFYKVHGYDRVEVRASGGLYAERYTFEDAVYACQQQVKIVQVAGTVS